MVEQLTTMNTNHVAGKEAEVLLMNTENIFVEKYENIFQNYHKIFLLNKSSAHREILDIKEDDIDKHKNI